MWSLRLTMTLFYALKSVWFYGTCAWCDFVAIPDEHVVLGWVVGFGWLRITFWEIRPSLNAPPVAKDLPRLWSVAACCDDTYKK